MMQSKQRYERAIKHRDEVMETLIDAFDFSIPREAGVYYSKRLGAELAVSGTRVMIEFASENNR